MSSNESYKLLGVEIRIDGKTTEQAKSLSERCTHFSQALTRINLPGEETIVGYKCVIAPSIRHAFPATCIPWKTLEKTQAKLTDTLLPRIGLNRHFPRVLCYASSYFGGLGRH